MFITEKQGGQGSQVPDIKVSGLTSEIFCCGGGSYGYRVVPYRNPG